MVAVSVKRSRASSHVDDGDIVLTNGGITLLSSIPGGINWTRQKLQRLANAVQAQMDDRRLIADLAPDDGDRVMSELPDADAQFTARYGGRMFIDGDSIVSRSDVISFTLLDGDVWPQITEVR